MMRCECTTYGGETPFVMLQQMIHTHSFSPSPPPFFERNTASNFMALGIIISSSIFSLRTCEQGQADGSFDCKSQGQGGRAGSISQ